MEVYHHSKTYGRRYDVNGTNRYLVDGLIAEGKKKVLKYMREYGASEASIKAYETDTFDHRQQQDAVDQSMLKRKSGAIAYKQ